MTRPASTRGTKENHKQPQPRQAVPRTRFKPGISEYGTWMLPNLRCCTRENTFLLVTISKPRTSAPHNLMFSGYKSSSALKRNLKTICNCSNGTRDSHSAYSMMLTDCRCKQGFCVIRNAEFQRLVYLANASTALHAQGAKRMQI